VSLSKATLFLYSTSKERTMPKLIIYLRNQDNEALAELAQQEYRVPKAQAALIIRRELERRGLVDLSNENDSQELEEPDHDNSLAS
jgi:hypothetical protein